jgi:hypothetical protein
MPLWGTPKAGANPISGLNFTDLRPGDYLTLFDGTETIATGSKSIAFARGGSGSGADMGSTFAVTGCPGGSVFDVQQSNTKTDDAGSLDAMDATFNTVTGDTINGNNSVTDIGRSMFYRLICTNFVAGDVPIANVKR